MAVLQMITGNFQYLRYPKY